MKNSIQLLGHLGQDPTARQFDSGRQLTTFSLATSERYRNAQGETVTDTQWHTVVAWGKLAQIASEHLQKGHQVLVRGKLQYRAFEDRQGQKQQRAEIVADELLLLGSHRRADAGASAQPAGHRAR